MAWGSDCRCGLGLKGAGIAGSRVWRSVCEEGFFKGFTLRQL